MAPDTPGRLRSAHNETSMPRSPSQSKRDRQLNIALHHSEVEALQARADAHGMRLVDFARANLLSMRAASMAVVLPSKLERLNLEQLKAIIELPARLWMNGIHHQMNMPIGFVVMGDKDRLVVGPSHVFQK